MKKTTGTRRTFQQEVRDAIATVREIQERVSQNDVYCLIAAEAAGLDLNTCYPRVTLLTFEAWKAYGRHVTKGAKALNVPVWKPMRARTENGWEVVTRTDKTTGEAKPQMIATTAYLFHISQTTAYTAEEIAKFCKGSPAPAFLPLTREQLAALAAPARVAPELAAAPQAEPQPEPEPLPVRISYGSTVIHSTAPAAIDAPEQIAADDERVAAGRDRFAGGRRAPGVMPLFANQ